MNRKRIWRGMKWAGALIGILLLLGGGYVWLEWPSHSEPSAAPKKITPSGDPVLDAIRRGLAFLQVHQEEDGNFVIGGLAPKPAFTSLVIDAFVTSPDKYRVSEHAFLQRAVDALVAEQKESGAIYTKIPGMSFRNYGTAVSVVALNHADPEKYAPVIAKAIAFLKKTQNLTEGEGQGGFGYDAGSRPDLNNTWSVAEALKEAGVPEDDPVWKNIEAFVARSQNRSESNKQTWAEDDGGFVYTPVGLTEEFNDGGRNSKHASYGTMGYTGLIAFLYANVDRNDPRVQSAFRWVREHYDLDENVGKKDMGLYYYYRIMAKALAAYGEPTIASPDGKNHNWAKDLAEQLMRLQDDDGGWRNANRAYLEYDAILVTAYVVRTLSLCHEQMARAEGE